MLPIEVLNLALSKEAESIEFYEKLIAEYQDVDLKDLLYHLLTQEQKHKAAIEKRIYELTHQNL